MSGPILQVRGLVKHFAVRKGLFGQAGQVKAVDDISFDLAAGETMALVGESGCGKSTVGRLVLRLIEPTSGEVTFEGREIFALPETEVRQLRRRMQIIFQDPYGSLNPRMTIGQMLAEPLKLHRLVPADRQTARVSQLLSLVGLPASFAGRYPHEFSGGQRQRIGIARALAGEPKLIVGDEPVSALDVSIQAQVLNLLKDLQQEFGLSYIFISHNLAVVRHIADRVAVMYLGKIVETAPTSALFREPRHPYTQALLAAIPRPDPLSIRRPAMLSGDVPSPLNPPAGCRFHTRCPHARDRCRLEEPAIEPAGEGHLLACHFWREIAPPGGLEEQGRSSAALKKLQQAFAASGADRANLVRSPRQE